LSEDPKGEVDSPNIYVAFTANPSRLNDAFGSQTAYEYSIDNSAGNMGFSLDDLPEEERVAIGRGFVNNIKSVVTAPYDYAKMCVKMGGCQNVDLLIVAKAGSHINNRMKDSKSLGGSNFEGAVVGIVELTPVVSEMVVANGEEPYGREYTKEEQGEARGSLMAEPILAVGGATVGSCTPGATQQLSKLRRFLSFDDVADLRGIKIFDDVVDDIGELSRNIEKKLDEVTPPLEVVGPGTTEEAGEKIVTRTTRAGDSGVRITRPDGSVIDITPNRVKEFVPNTHPEAPPGTLQRVKFKNAQPGSKGFKRNPTPEDLKLLEESLKRR
jgi:hypothetical protein